MCSWSGASVPCGAFWWTGQLIEKVGPLVGTCQVLTQNSGGQTSSCKSVRHLPTESSAVLMKEVAPTARVFERWNSPTWILKPGLYTIASATHSSRGFAGGFGLVAYLGDSG
ncbi:hypothetical protein V2G26_014123 [Clonostachys chloroleuca]